MVKKGFIETEAGIIPEDWNSVRLLDMAQLLNGLTYTPDNVKEYGLLVIRSSNVQNGQLCFDDNVYVDCSVSEEKLIHKDDIIICVRNGSPALIGKCAKATSDYNATFGAFMAVVRSENAGFIYQAFSRGELQRQIRKHSDATINQITNKDFNGIYIGIPNDKKETDRIVLALSDTDTLIENLQKLIRKKKDIWQGTIQSLVSGKCRLCGFTKSWKRVRFSEVCSISAPMVNPREQQYALLPHIGNESIEKHTGRLLEYNKVIDDNLISGKYLFTETDVLYGKINPQFGKVAYPKFLGLCSADMYPISCKNGLIPDYLKYVLLTYDFLQYTIALSLRSGMPKVNRKELSDYEFFVPEEDEQKAIAEILSDMDLEIEKFEEKLSKYQKLKQGMMEELLTGKVRLM